jgi:hypothetical protein
MKLKNRGQKTVDSGQDLEDQKMIRTEEQTEKVCEDCRFSIASGGRGRRIFTCLNKAGSPGRMWVVEADEYCANFTIEQELLDPEVAKALAEGAKLIPVTQRKFAIVDTEDYGWLNKYKWFVFCQNPTCYAGRTGVNSNRHILMHREILNCPPDLVVDHINHNGLDNRKQNLRICTRSQNNRNRRPQGKTSRYKGVCRDKRRDKFVARIYLNGKQIHLGYFDDEIAAAKAYDKAARELFGQFAYLNFPQDYGLPSRTS